MNTTQEIFEKILSNEKLIKEFAEKENENDLYHFCKSIDERCTREEFDEFIFNALESIYSELKSKNYELSPENLENISGGFNVKNFSKKGLASLLATFSMFYTTPSSAMENPKILTPSCGGYIIDTSTDTDYPGASAPPLDSDNPENENTACPKPNNKSDSDHFNTDQDNKLDTALDKTKIFFHNHGNQVVLSVGVAILIGSGIWLIKQGKKDLTKKQIKARRKLIKVILQSIGNLIDKLLKTTNKNHNKH